MASSFPIEGSCFKRVFCYTVLSKTNNFKQIYLTHRLDPNRYYHPELEPGSDSNEEVLQTFQI